MNCYLQNLKLKRASEHHEVMSVIEASLPARQDARKIWIDAHGLSSVLEANKRGLPHLRESPNKRTAEYRSRTHKRLEELTT